MKVTLDLDALVAEGRITEDDARELLAMASRDTVSGALNILVIVGVIAVVAGAIVLAPSANTALVIGVMLGAVGVLGEQLATAGWGMLRQMLILIGAMLACGAFIVINKGTTASVAISSMALTGLALWSGSGLLAALGALLVGPLLHAGSDYEHAMYSVWVEQPTLTIAVFGGLALLSLWISGQVQARASRALIVYSRTCLFLAQFGFWVGSLWGETGGHAGPDGAAGSQRISPETFAIGWAFALLTTGVWAARENRRWVVNLCAVFGMIHFYTQWFERLHASAGTVLGAGIVTLLVALLLRRYNQGDAPLNPASGEEHGPPASPSDPRTA